VILYAIRRLIVGFIQVAVVALAAFVILRLLPEDPTAIFAGATADDASRAQVAKQLGLDQPIGAQLVSLVTEAVHGSLGTSWVTQRPVLDEIGAHLPITLQLVLSGLTIAVILGTLLGYAIAAAESSGMRNRPQPLAAIGRGFVLASGSQPEFWWGLVFIAVFFKLLGWVPPPFGVLSAGIPAPAPVTGFMWFDAILAGNWRALGNFAAHMVLPVATVASVLIGPIAKVVRESVLPVMSAPYYMNLLTQGAGRWRRLRCVVRNGGAPVVMLLGVLFGPVLGGAALAETIYSIDGLARLTVHSILGADYPMVEGCVATIAALCLFAYLVADIAASALNPILRRRSATRRPSAGRLSAWWSLPGSQAAASTGPRRGPG
jgi:ABC-type dipeptide/oligopeptide/nickel transport system permease component